MNWAAKRQTLAVFPLFTSGTAPGGGNEKIKRSKIDRKHTEKTKQGKRSGTA